MSMSTYPRVLTIAGSDSSGGAGIEADLKVITAHKCYGMTAITALTAQNTTGVTDIHNVPPEFLRKSLKAVIEDVGVDVVKIGMLANAEIMDVVLETLLRYHIRKLVIDPVMVATSGAVLLPTSAIDKLCLYLLPLATIITPNIPEAQQILNYFRKKGLENLPENPVTSLEDLVELAKSIYGHCKTNILVKGGHMQHFQAGEPVQPRIAKAKVGDVLVRYPSGDIEIFESDYIPSKNTHGTGCTLASAIASNMAKGLSIRDAVIKGRDYVAGAIASAVPLGKGNGPVNHVHNIYQLPFSKGRFLDYLISHPRVAPIWEEYVNHSFTKKIADGTLPLENFKWFLKQDYLFLTHFARANALAGYKSSDMKSIASAAETVLSIKTEMELHIKYCKDFGLSEEDMKQEPESQAGIAYTRYVLDVGASQDYEALQVALAACLFGYEVIGNLRYDEEDSKREANRYWVL